MSNNPCPYIQKSNKSSEIFLCVPDLLCVEIRYGAMMPGPPPGPMPPNAPPSNYTAGPPQRGVYTNGISRDRTSGPPPRFNDRGFQNQDKQGLPKLL